MRGTADRERRRSSSESVGRSHYIQGKEASVWHLQRKIVIERSAIGAFNSNNSSYK